MYVHKCSMCCLQTWYRSCRSSPSASLHQIVGSVYLFPNVHACYRDLCDHISRKRSAYLRYYSPNNALYSQFERRKKVATNLSDNVMSNKKWRPYFLVIEQFKELELHHSHVQSCCTIINFVAALCLRYELEETTSHCFQRAPNNVSPFPGVHNLRPLQPHAAFH